jgi:hypothetical protein
MTQIIRIPRDFDKERCTNCWKMMRVEGKSYKEAKAEHAHCHDWTHCGVKCCGPCPHCGGDRNREVY